MQAGQNVADALTEQCLESIDISEHVGQAALVVAAETLTEQKVFSLETTTRVACSNDALRTEHRTMDRNSVVGRLCGHIFKVFKETEHVMTFVLDLIPPNQLVYRVKYKILWTPHDAVEYAEVDRFDHKQSNIRVTLLLSQLPPCPTPPQIIYTSDGHHRGIICCAN